MARKVVYCPYCAATNGAVKKAGALKIIHDKFRAKKTADELERFKRSFTNAIDAQKDLAMYVNRAVHEDLNPLKVLDLFKRMSDEVRAGDHIHAQSSFVYGGARIASCSGSVLRLVDRKSSYGNISPFPLLPSGHPWRKTALQMKTT